MPFDPEFNQIFEQLIKPTLEQEGFEVRRADSTLDQQNILKTIVYNIDVADLIIAELTTSNPNVFYELGVAHGLSKPVVLLSQDLGEVPFDLRSYRIITYSTHFDQIRKLKDELSDIAHGLKEGSISFGSPVKDFAPSIAGTRSSTVIVPTREEATREPGSEAAELEEDSGVLDFIAEVEDSIAQILTIVINFSGMIESFGQRSEELAAEVQMLSGSGVQGRASRMRKVTGAFAAEIKSLGDNIEAELPSFHNAWKRMEAGFTKLLTATLVESTEDRDQAIELLSQLEEFQLAVGAGREGLQESRDAFANNTGLSRELNVAIRGTVKVLDTLIEELSTGESSLARMTNLLDQKIPSIGLTQPTEGDTISDPVHVVGSGRAFEGTIRLRVKDKTGAIIAEDSVIGGTIRIEDFDADLSFSQTPQHELGIIEAYALDEQGDSEMNLVSVPIKFSKSSGQS